MATRQQFQQRARTKIVATVGPASQSEKRLGEMVQAGVDLFRLNLAHATIDQHDAVVESIRRVARQLKTPLAILADLPGPKIRLGELPGGELVCHADEMVRFVQGPSALQPGDLVSTYEPLIDELSPGDRVMLADGTVSLRVTEKRPDEVFCQVVQPGRVRSGQGIHLPDVTLSATAPTAEDLEHAEWVAKRELDFVGLSFTSKAADVRQLQDALQSHGSAAQVVAKIERREGLVNLEEIVEAADAVMVARGDLGVEIDVAEVPVVQKQIVAACRRRNRPVIIATQMLESMRHATRPTRAEATDVASAIVDGADACMLSGETAIGEHPVLVVETMNRIALVTEASMRDRPPLPASGSPAQGVHSVTHAVVEGANQIAHRLQARLVVVITRSGATALAVSSGRSFVPTLGVSPSEAILRKMCLYWGVTPLAVVPAGSVEQAVEQVEAWARSEAYLNPGDRIVVICGSAIARGVHDMVMVHEIAADNDTGG